MMVIPPAIGVILIFFGIVLFIRRPERNQPWSAHRRGHHNATCRRPGAPWGGRTVLGRVARCPGGGRDAHGRRALRTLGFFARLQREAGPYRQGGDDRRGGHREKPRGVSSSGWVFVHGERWRALLAFALEETDPRESEPMLGIGRKVRVVGFGEGGVMQVVPIELPGRGRDLDGPG
jgi:hypothetical protein